MPPKGKKKGQAAPAAAALPPVESDPDSEAKKVAGRG